MTWGNFKRAKGNKYGRTKTEANGIWFDSRAEAALYHRLALEERGGRIRNLKPQPGTVYLSAARIGYRPDFSYEDTKTEEIIWVEYKGFETDVWRLKRKLWTYYGPGPLAIWKGAAASLRLMETLIPKGGGISQASGEEE